MRALALAAAALCLGGCTTVGLETDQHDLVFFGDPGATRVLEASALPLVDLDVTGDAAAKQVRASIAVTVWKRSGEAHFDQTQGQFVASGDTLAFSLLDPNDSEETTIEGVYLNLPASLGLRVHHAANLVTARGLLGPVEIEARVIQVDDVGPVNLTADSVSGRLGRGGRISTQYGANLVVTGRNFEALTVNAGDGVTLELPPGQGFDLDLAIGTEGLIHVMAGSTDVVAGGKSQEHHPRLQVGGGGPRIVVTAQKGPIIIKDFPGPLPLPARS